MTVLDFQQLEQTKQLEWIKQDGCFLHHRQEVDVDIVLYQVQSFYAELYFSSSKTGNITHIEAFDGEKLPEHYTRDIDISEIVDQLNQQ